MEEEKYTIYDLEQQVSESAESSEVSDRTTVRDSG